MIFKIEKYIYCNFIIYNIKKLFRISDNDTDCVAIAHGQMGGFISIPVIRNDTDCPNNQKNCYEAVEPLENVICNGFGMVNASHRIFF